MSKKPEWWPDNPYPVDVFPLELEDIDTILPSKIDRTRVSGCLGRLFWELASDAIYEAMKNNLTQAHELVD